MSNRHKDHWLSRSAPDTFNKITLNLSAGDEPCLDICLSRVAYNELARALKIRGLAFPGAPMDDEPVSICSLAPYHGGMIRIQGLRRLAEQAQAVKIRTLAAIHKLAGK